MKASSALAMVARTPPRVLSLLPNAFADTWKDKSAHPVMVGLKRIAEADQRAARVEAVKKVDALHQDLVHDDPIWIEAYNQALMHACLGFALTRPDDMTQPLWPLQFDVLPHRLTEGGVERLFDELELLTVLDSPCRPEATDVALADFTVRLGAGEFWTTLSVPDHDLAGMEEPLRRQALARRRVRLEVQIRRVLAFALELAAGEPLVPGDDGGSAHKPPVR
jgi:hypothetical protein